MKNFNEIYTKVCEEAHNSNIEETRKNYLKKKRIHSLITLIILGILILLFINSGLYPMIIVTLFLVPVLSLATFSSQFTSYTKTFKENVISPLVKNYDEHLSFDPHGRMDSSSYNQAEFESYDFFYSNDLITGLVDGKMPIKFGDVHTEVETRDSDGNTTRSTVFRGLFSAVKLPFSPNSELFGTTIKVRNDSGNFAKMFTKKVNVNMDSQEFEKYFDVYSTNKILAMRVFTSDIMNYMINFRIENKIKFEITIKGSSLYLRIPCADMFEARTNKNPTDFDTLHTYFKYIDFICQLNTMIYNVIEEKEI